MEGSGLSATPQAPLFGMAGAADSAQNSKYINIDEIFAECFMESDPDLMTLMAANQADKGGAAAAAAGGGGVSALGYAAGLQPQALASQGMYSVGQQQQLSGVGGSLQQQPPRGGGGRSGGGGGGGGGAGVTRPAPAPAPGAEADDDDGRRKRPRTGGSRSMSEQQKLERRERNREHAKRSRVRKKFLLESLQKSVSALQEENDRLRSAIRENCSDANDLLARSESAAGGVLAATPGEANRVLDDPDYSLVRALQTAQQNFVITDPTLPDNPIVFASQGFLDLTGYSLEQVLGRNCRFLQGPDTDPKAVERIRTAIESGCDTSVCLLNYRSDGTTFWNQFFIAALRDADGKIINYVGVQCKVSEEFVQAVQKQDEEDNDPDNDDDDDDA